MLVAHPRFGFALALHSAGAGHRPTVLGFGLAGQAKGETGRTRSEGEERRPVVGCGAAMRGRGLDILWDKHSLGKG